MIVIAVRAEQCEDCEGSKDERKYARGSHALHVARGRAKARNLSVVPGTRWPGGSESWPQDGRQIQGYDVKSVESLARVPVLVLPIARHEQRLPVERL